MDRGGANSFVSSSSNSTLNVSALTRSGGPTPPPALQRQGPHSSPNQNSADLRKSAVATALVPSGLLERQPSPVKSSIVQGGHRLQSGSSPGGQRALPASQDPVPRHGPIVRTPRGGSPSSTPKRSSPGYSAVGAHTTRPPQKTKSPEPHPVAVSPAAAQHTPVNFTTLAPHSTSTADSSTYLSVLKRPETRGLETRSRDPVQSPASPMASRTHRGLLPPPVGGSLHRHSSSSSNPSPVAPAAAGSESRSSSAKGGAGVLPSPSVSTISLSPTSLSSSTPPPSSALQPPVPPVVTYDATSTPVSQKSSSTLLTSRIAPFQECTVSRQPLPPPPPARESIANPKGVTQQQQHLFKGQLVLVSRYYMKWCRYLQRQRTLIHLHACAVSLQHRQSRALAQQYLVRWLGIVQQRTRNTWRETVWAHWNRDKLVPLSVNDDTPSISHRMLCRVVPLRHTQDAVHLGKSYFLRWKAFYRLRTQRRAALMRGCGLLERRAPQASGRQSQSASSRKSLVVQLHLPHAARVFRQWQLWAMQRQSEKQHQSSSLTKDAHRETLEREKELEVSTLTGEMETKQRQLEDQERELKKMKRVLAEEVAHAQQLEQALQRTRAELQRERDLREREKQDRLRDLIALREEFEMLQEQSRAEHQEARQFREAAEQRRQEHLASPSPHFEREEDCRDEEVGLTEEEDEQGEESVRPESSRATSAFPTSAFRKVCEAYRAEEDKALEEARGWLTQLTLKLKRWNSASGKMSLDANCIPTSPPTSSNSKKAQRQACQQHMISLSKEAWQEGMRLLHGLQYLQEAAEAYDAENSPPNEPERGMTPSAKGNEREKHSVSEQSHGEPRKVCREPEDSRLPPYERLFQRLKRMQRDLMSLRLAAENALGLMTPVEASHRPHHARPAAMNNEELTTTGVMKQGSAHHEPSTSTMPSSVSSGATLRCASAMYTSLSAETLSDTLLLQTQQMTYAYELCCEGLQLPRVAPVVLLQTTARPSSMRDSCPGDQSENASKSSSAGSEESLGSGEDSPKRMEVVATQLRRIHEAGRDYRESIRAKEEMQGLLNVLYGTEAASDEVGGDDEQIAVLRGSGSPPAVGANRNKAATPPGLKHHNRKSWMELCAGIQEIVRQHRTAHALLFQCLQLLRDPLQQSHVSLAGSSAACEPPHSATTSPDKMNDATHQRVAVQVEEWFGAPSSRVFELVAASTKEDDPVVPSCRSLSSHRKSWRGTMLYKSNEAVMMRWVLVALQQAVQREISTTHRTLHQQLRSLLEVLWNSDQHTLAVKENGKEHKKKEKGSRHHSVPSRPSSIPRWEGVLQKTSPGGASDDHSLVKRTATTKTTTARSASSPSKIMKRVAFVQEVPKNRHATPERSDGGSSEETQGDEEETRAPIEHFFAPLLGNGTAQSHAAASSRKAYPTANLSHLLQSLVLWHVTQPKGSAGASPALASAGSTSTEQASLLLLPYHPSSALQSELAAAAVKNPAVPPTPGAALEENGAPDGEASPAVLFPLQTRVYLLEEAVSQRDGQLRDLKEENRALRAELVGMVAETGEDLSLIKSHLEQRYVDREQMEAERRVWETSMEEQRYHREEEVRSLRKAVEVSATALASLIQMIFPFQDDNFCEVLSQKTAPLQKRGEPNRSGGIHLQVTSTPPTASHLSRLILQEVQQNISGVDGVEEHSEDSANGSDPASVKKSSRIRKQRHASSSLSVCLEALRRGFFHFWVHLQRELRQLRQEARATRSMLVNLPRSFFAPVETLTPAGKHHTSTTGAAECGSHTSSGTTAAQRHALSSSYSGEDVRDGNGIPHCDSPGGASWNTHELLKCSFERYHQVHSQELVKERDALRASYASRQAARDRELQVLRREKQMMERKLCEEAALHRKWRADLVRLQEQYSLALGTSSSALRRETSAPGHHLTSLAAATQRKQRRFELVQEELARGVRGERVGDDQPSGNATPPPSHAAGCGANPVPDSSSHALLSGLEAPSGFISLQEVSRLLSDVLQRVSGGSDLQQLYAHTLDEMLQLYRILQQSLFYILQSYHQKYVPDVFASRSLWKKSCISSDVAAVKDREDASQQLMLASERFAEAVTEQLEQLEAVDHSVRTLWSKHLPALLRPPV